MEKLCVVKCKKTPAAYLPWFLLWVITACLVVASFAFGASSLFFVGLAVGIVNVFFCAPKSISYDYTYFGGEINIARIRGDNRRKLVQTINMEDVQTITAAGDPGLYNAENEPGAIKKDYTSKTGEGTVYKIVIRDRNKTTIISIEPTDDFLDAICEKYSRIVTRIR